MIPRIIHQFWAGPMPLDVIRWTASVIECNPFFKFHLWNTESIMELGMDSDLALVKYGSWAGVSNAVRILAVQKYGGIWIDSDCECVKPLEPLLQFSAFAAIQDFEGNESGRLNGAVFGAEPHHPWVEWQAKRMEAVSDKCPLWIVYLQTNAPRDGLTILPTSYFYPFLHTAPPSDRVVKPDSYLIHHWLGSWK